MHQPHWTLRHAYCIHRTNAPPMEHAMMCRTSAAAAARHERRRPGAERRCAAAAAVSMVCRCLRLAVACWGVLGVCLARSTAHTRRGAGWGSAAGRGSIGRSSGSAGGLADGAHGKATGLLGTGLAGERLGGARHRAGEGCRGCNARCRAVRAPRHSPLDGGKMARQCGAGGSPGSDRSSPSRAAAIQLCVSSARSRKLPARLTLNTCPSSGRGGQSPPIRHAGARIGSTAAAGGGSSLAAVREQGGRCSYAAARPTGRRSAAAGPGGAAAGRQRLRV